MKIWREDGLPIVHHRWHELLVKESLVSIVQVPVPMINVESLVGIVLILINSLSLSHVFCRKALWYYAAVGDPRITLLDASMFHVWILNQHRKSSHIPLQVWIRLLIKLLFMELKASINLSRAKHQIFQHMSKIGTIPVHYFCKLLPLDVHRQVHVRGRVF